MTDIHPHWHSTEGEAVPVRAAGQPVSAASVASPSAPAPKRSVSRLPAAAVGILVVVAIGAVLVQGWGGLKGQVSGSGSAAGAAAGTGIVIHVATGGLLPASVTVNPGQTITWVNDQKVPQIFESDTLKTDDGQKLYTSVIFPGDRLQYHVPDTQSAGSYQYDSVTTSGMKGTIVVCPGSGSSTSQLFGGTEGLNLPSGEGSLAGCTPTVNGSGSAGTAASSVSSANAEHPAAGDPINVQTFGNGTQQATVSNSSVGGGVTATQVVGANGGTQQVVSNNSSFDNGTTVTPASGGSGFPQQQANVNGGNVTATQTAGGNGNNLIPVNPYTIGTTKPKTTGNGKNTASATANKSPKPLRQPESGPEVWVAIALSVGVLLFSTRRQMQAYVK